MPFVDGDRCVSARTRRTAVADIISILRVRARCTHARGVMHRDIKPDNAAQRRFGGGV
jgi:serine/threonine protein kinase